jgi:endonuclease/exonuclease/phosphatase family metal-dependent hydrolase
MRPILAALALSLLACEPPLPPPAVTGSGGGALVRVVTWNVHDLFDSEDRLLPPGERDTVPSPAEVESKLGRLAAVLVRLDADVVLLQEVENLPLLERLGARAGYLEARLIEGDDPRGIDVAALSRLPLQAYVSHRDDRDLDGGPLWPRDCVEVHFSVAGARVVALGSHFSSPLSDDGTRRTRQAARMRALADGLAAGGAALVMAGGDLNDDPAASSLAPLLGDGRWIGPAAALPLDAAWTWSGGGAREILDYLLVPRGAGAAVVRAAAEGGDDVAAASDHRPVVLDVWLR